MATTIFLLTIPSIIFACHVVPPCKLRPVDCWMVNDDAIFTAVPRCEIHRLILPTISVVIVLIKRVAIFVTQRPFFPDSM
ncbi:hypothetical protein GGS24DRAFT_465016 [Hypoxylon argillaceum]|nr:hypothetical protein GGS24DRAFT_465016 [Hypoxylon argillaceum]